MGLLDPKERILDVVLTARGKDQLSKNLLNFKYFAFSDEGVDYSGSLNAVTTASTGSMDSYIRRNIHFEATQKKDHLGIRDLSSFLYTVPHGSKVLPELVSNIANEATVNVERRFFMDVITWYTTEKVRVSIKEPEAVIVRSTLPKTTFSSKLTDYVNQQLTQFTNTRLEGGKNSVGLYLNGFVVIDEDKTLNPESGKIVPIDQAQKYEVRDKIVSHKREVEVVTGIDREKIEFRLKTADGELEVKDGFLIEVFESGSDGRLTKLPKRNIVDISTDEISQEGYLSFMFFRKDG